MEDSDGDEVPLDQVQNHLFQGAESGYDSENTAHDDGRMASNNSEAYEDDDSLGGVDDDQRPGNENVSDEDNDEDEDEDEQEVEEEEIEEEEVEEDGEEAEEAVEMVDVAEDEDIELEKEELGTNKMVSQQDGHELRVEGNQADGYGDGDGDDDEDDIPLAARMNTVTPPSPKMQRLRFFKNADDDDVPLATLYKRHKPKRKYRAKASSSRATSSRATSSRATSSRATSSRAASSRASSSKASSSRARSGRVSKREPKPRARSTQRKKEKEESVRKFEKIGQRRETPLDNDPLRLFYQSMYKEKLSKGKHSYVAENWCLRHGIFEEDTAKDIISRWQLAR